MQHISLRYGDGPYILRDINLTLDEGSFHFLTGPSGAGKTSLLKLVFLAHPPSAGTLRLFGETIADLSRAQTALVRRQIGVIFQDFRLIDHLSVYENVALPLRVAGKREAHYRDNALELLDWVGLAHHVHALPPILSGGEKQRVALARAVMAQPKLIVADEPTGNVDAAMGARLLGLLNALHQRGTTILIATHDDTIQKHFKHPRLHLEDSRLERLL